MNRTVLTFLSILCLVPTVFLMGLSFNIRIVKVNVLSKIRADGTREPSIFSVKPGDWARYKVTYNYTTNDPEPPWNLGDWELIEDAEAYEVEVKEVNHKKVTFKEVAMLQNRTKISKTKTMNLTACHPSIWFIPANLDPGDLVYGSCSNSRATINETQLRTYCGAVEEVNYIYNHEEYYYSPNYMMKATNHVYFDKQTGILFEINATGYITELTEGYETYAFVRFLIDETSIWGGEVITIEDNGSIYPLTAPISSVDNVTYILTDNITSNDNGIIVYRDNIVIDGAGYTLKGKGARSSEGIFILDPLLKGRNNITVKNMEIKGFTYGIRLIFSSYADIYGNNITNNEYCGICLEESNYNNISENIITNSYKGISICSSNNNVSENYLTNCSYGIYLYGARNNNIIENDVLQNIVGIELCSFSSNNNIFGNNIAANNPSGISLYFSGENNIISLNNISNNYCGIDLSRSSNNLILHNIFMNNRDQADIFPDPMGHYYENVWNDGYPSGGNYWSDYNGVDLYGGLYQNETGSDGIGDNPYIIAENNQDKYPLMTPITPLYYELLEKYNELLADYHNLNSTYYDLLDSYVGLLADLGALNATYNNLLADQEAIKNELSNIQNLMYIFIGTTIVFITTTVYLAIRKAKIKP